MLGFQGPAQPSPTLGDAINAGFGYLEVKCLGCNTHQTVALDIVRRPKTTPVHELERYMRCSDCSEVRGYPYKRSHLVALRATKIIGERSALDVVAGRAVMKVNRCPARHLISANKLPLIATWNVLARHSIPARSIGQSITHWSS